MRTDSPRAPAPNGAAPSVEGLFAVVVNWNGGTEQNLVCVRSLVEQGVPEGRIVFVDNASVDGSREAVDGAHPRLVRIDNGSNLGFGEAANQGAELALERGASAIVFVNNDLRFPSEERTLEVLVRALALDAGLGAVGPRVLFDDGTERVWCAGGRIDHRQNISTLLGNGEPDGPDWRRTFDVDYVAGCALVVRADVLRSVGLFDASYFAYMEDVELGKRIRAAGHAVRTVGEVRAYHAPSSATGGGYGAQRKWMQGLNSVRYLREHGGVREWARFAAFDVLSLPIVLAARSRRGEGRAALAKAKGIWDGLLGRRVTAEGLRPGASRLWPDVAERDAEGATDDSRP